MIKYQKFTFALFLIAACMQLQAKMHRRSLKILNNSLHEVILIDHNNKKHVISSYSNPTLDIFYNCNIHFSLENAHAATLKENNEKAMICLCKDGQTYSHEIRLFPETVIIVIEPDESQDRIKIIQLKLSSISETEINLQ